MSKEIKINQEDHGAVLDFRKKLGWLNSKDIRALMFFNLEFDVKDLGEAAKKVPPEEQNLARYALKRVLLSNNPASSASVYINEHLLDLAYSAQEQELITQEKTIRDKKEQIIAQEIAEGKNPWLAHIDQNEQSYLNPFPVAFYQDPNGKIKTIFGPRYFRSKRQVENSFLGGRSEYKEANLLTTEFFDTEGGLIMRGPGWEALPTDLRQQLDDKKILVTSYDDLYAITNTEIDQLAQSDDPYAYQNLVKAKIEHAVSLGHKYFLLYYSDYGGDSTGRTGVIMVAEAGEIKPLIAEVNGKEFIVEVKGCGQKTGGFGEMQFRTGRDIMTGGAEMEQAEIEFYRLHDDERDTSPTSASSTLFHNKGRNDYAQGYIVRLSPGTVRGSYTGIDAYPDICEEPIVLEVLDMYSSQLADHIFSIQAKIMDRSSHTENMLLWGDSEFSWTDYSDQVAFSDGSFPHNDNHGGYLTPKRMLEFYIKMVKEIPGYKELRDQEYFYNSLMLAFAKYGVDLNLSKDDKVENLVEEIWSRCMAYRVFEAKQQGGYYPSGVINEYKESMGWKFNIENLGFNSVDNFLAKEKQARIDILKGIEILETKAGDRIGAETIANWKNKFAQAPLSELIGLVETLSKKYYEQYDLLEEHERRKIYKAISFFTDIKYVLLSKFMDYFEHELDTVKSAQKSAPISQTEILQNAQKEIEQRIEHLLYLLDNDLNTLYQMLTDISQVKGLVGFSFYGYKKQT